MIFVKSGNITSAVIRDLRGVVTREGAACGILITRHPPSKPMIQKVKEAEEAARQLIPEWWRTPPRLLSAAAAQFRR